MENQTLQEIYGNEARVELSLISYLKIALFMSLGVSIIFLITANTFVTTTASSPEHASTMTVWLSFVSFAGAFIISMLGALISYPFYSFLCNKNKGQRLIGKFAILKESSNK